ncbi:MAG TPA: hypothetical protein VMI75_21215 [Polyangiaceae bacterium]|nr:hypothetical protein [Polyangiaceae bacterium]
MAERIRLRAWVLGLGPIVVVLGAAAVLLLGSGKKPVAKTGVAASEPTSTAAAADPTSTMPTPVVSLPAPAAPPPPPASVPPIVAAAASSLLLAGPPPEPIPELDALARPKGSDQWTTEQKLAYREQVFRSLDDKERSLENEIARARRRGDTQTLQEKQTTLDYLRARRAAIESALKRHDPLGDAPADAGN